MAYVYLFLVIAGYAVIQCLISGTRLLFCFPAYGLVALAGVLTLVSIRRKAPRPALTCLLSSTCFFAYLLWRESVSPVEYLAMPDHYSIIACLTVYLLTAFYITKPVHRGIILGALLTLALVHVFVGLIQFTKGNDFMLFGFKRPLSGIRASGMFICADHMAGYLESVGIAGLSIALWSRWRPWLKILVAYVAVCCLVGVAISGSRGGYLSTMFSLVVCAAFGLYIVKQIRPDRVAVLTITLVAGIVLFVGAACFLMSQNAMLQGRLGTLFKKDVRIYNWQAALDQYRVSPWIGTGAGTHLIYGRLFRRQQIQADPIHAHCDYLELLSEYGIAGFSLMLVFLGCHVGSGIRAFRWIVDHRIRETQLAQSNALALNVGTLCAVAAIFAHSVVDFNLHIPGNALLFAFFFGMLANPGTDEGEKAGWFSKSWPLAYKLAIPALSAWIILAGFVSIDFAPGSYILVDHIAFPSRFLSGEYWTEQSRIALRNRAFGEAVEDGNKALACESGNPLVFFYLGEANRGLALTMGIRNRILKKIYGDRAIDAYRGGLAVFPNDENLLLRLGQTLDMLGRFPEAEEAFQKCLQSDPNLGVLHGYYGTHLLAEGKKAEAEAEYNKTRELGANAKLGQAELGIE